MAALAALRAQTGTAPLLLRIEEGHTNRIAGMTASTVASDTEKSFRSLRLLVAQTKPVWVAGWKRGRGFWWGDRAAALADQCTAHSWGAQPQGWAAYPPLHQLRGTTAAGDPGDCPVCLETFTDLLPRPPRLAQHARSSDLFHGCPGPHAACVSCDRRLALLPQPRCVMCRRARHPWATLQ